MKTYLRLITATVLVTAFMLQATPAHAAPSVPSSRAVAATASVEPTIGIVRPDPRPSFWYLRYLEERDRADREHARADAWHAAYDRVHHAWAAWRAAAEHHWRALVALRRHHKTEHVR